MDASNERALGSGMGMDDAITGSGMRGTTSSEEDDDDDEEEQQDVEAASTASGASNLDWEDSTLLSFPGSAAAAAEGPLDSGLYLVGTPIGNLEDISYRALRVLRTADVVLAEDTRRSGMLCKRFGIRARLVSCHEHNEKLRSTEVMALLHGGGAVALISDAGMPGISDPGAVLVAAAVAAGHPVIPIPGPCAALAALVASGLPTDEFHFAGFLPPKRKACEARLQQLQGVPGTLVLYVSPHSLRRVLQQAAQVMGPGRRVVLARELTKMHEEFQRMTLADAVEEYTDRKPRGEYVMLLEGAGTAPPGTGIGVGSTSASTRSERAQGMDPTQEQDPGSDTGMVGWETQLRQLLSTGTAVSQAAKQVALATGTPRKTVYAAALQMRDAAQLAPE